MPTPYRGIIVMSVLGTVSILGVGSVFESNGPTFWSWSLLALTAYSWWHGSFSAVKVNVEEREAKRAAR